MIVSKTMRILIACDQHWPMVSGVATASRTLALALAKRGHDVLVIAPSQTGQEYEETDINYHIVRTKSVPMPMRQNIRISVSFQNKIKKIIADFAPDIIHVHTQFLGLAAIAAGKKLGIPIVATNHVMPENLLENYKFLQPLARPIKHTLKEYGLLLYKDAQHIIMPTQSALDMFNPISDAIPMSAISNGVDLSSYKPGKVDADFFDRFGLPHHTPIVVCLCRLDREKHVSVLIHAIRILRDEGINVHCLLVGHGNDAEDLRALVEELGLQGHVTFAGLVSDADKIQALQAATVFAMPSPAELQCLALLEGMATGLPAVAVKAGAVHELCQDGVNGYMCEVDDSVDIAAKLGMILDDPDMQKRFAKASLAIARKHDVAQVVKEFEAVYKKVLATPVAPKKTLFTV